MKAKKIYDILKPKSGPEFERAKLKFREQVKDLDEYFLNDGRSIWIISTSINGMAGEQIQMIMGLDEYGKELFLDNELLMLLTPEDREEIQGYIDDINDDNASQAENWTR